ncbi:MAG: hypothetical protein QOG04_410 [Actinomycetota bacterium]|nr:hypothetical protein [Actinomycetota bacterium]
MGSLEFLLFPIAVLGLLGMGVAALLGSRREEDPLGRRPYTIYLSAVSFIALFVLLFALFSAISGLGKIVFTEGQRPGDCFGSGFGQVCSTSSMSSGMVMEGDSFRGPDQSSPSHDQDVRNVVQQVATGLMALLVLLFHTRRLRSLSAEPTFDGSAAERTYINYLYAVCFAAVLVALSSGGAFLFAAYRAIAPGTVAFANDIDSEREDALVQLLSSGALTAVSLWLFKMKWTKIESRSGPLAPSGSPEATAS